MVDKGKYRNEIKELSLPNIRDYDRIFKIFKQSIDDKEFYRYNIMSKIEFPEIDTRYIEFYTPPSRMALTILSNKIYGDIKSWWILYLLNRDKFDDAPFFIEGGVQIRYITDELRSAIYQDITDSTLLGGRHY